MEQFASRFVPSQPEPTVPVLWNVTVAGETDVTAQNAAAARRPANKRAFIFWVCGVLKRCSMTRRQRRSRPDTMGAAGWNSGCHKIPETTGRKHPPSEGLGKPQRADGQ